MPVDYDKLRSVVVANSRRKAVAPAPAPQREHVERDGLLFLETLYGREPAGLILISTPHGRSWPTHACMSPQSALGYIVGTVDVYHRVTLVEHKPRNGRGTALDTIALTGVWLDCDVNGSPDGRGGEVRNAFADLETATAFVGSILAPTMLVCSGWGVHAYWLFPTAHMLNGDRAASTAAAGDMVKAWHGRMRLQAQSFGVPKFDSVYDLARVLRPVGSLNGKGGGVPVPVTLITTDGPRYGVEEIKAASAAGQPVSSLRVTRDPAPPSVEVIDRSVAELLAKYPTLRKIVEREAVPPGKGSDSEWDHWLACTAQEPPRNCTDNECAALVRYNRTVNPDPEGKATREDYVLRTVAAARKVTGTSNEAAQEATGRPLAPLEVINRHWPTLDDPVTVGRSTGTGGGAHVWLERASGAVIFIDRLSSLFDRASHNREVAMWLHGLPRPLTYAECLAVGQAVSEVCEVRQMSAAEATDQLLSEFIAQVQILDAVLHGSAAQRHRALVELEDAEREARAPSLTQRSFCLRDEFGRVWVPSTRFREFARWPAHPDLESDMEYLGWRKSTIRVRTPGTPRDSNSHRPRRVFWVQPEGDE